MLYLVMWPRMGRVYPMRAEILNGLELRRTLDHGEVLPTGIYRLDALREPLRLYLITMKNGWLLQDQFGNVEDLKEECA